MIQTVEDTIQTVTNNKQEEKKEERKTIYELNLDLQEIETKTKEEEHRPWLII